MNVIFEIYTNKGGNKITINFNNPFFYHNKFIIVIHIIIIITVIIIKCNIKILMDYNL